MEAVTIFSDRIGYRRELRVDLADLLRPFWKDRPFNDQERLAMYGISEREVRFVGDPGEAQVAVLPFDWNWYVQKGRVAEAAQFIAASRTHKLPVISYVSGDRGVRVPSGFDDVFVVRASGRRRFQRARQVAQPVFFEQFGEGHPEFGGTAVPDGDLPLVGFCGQGRVGWSRTLVTVGRTVLRNAGCRLGWVPEEPDALYPAARLRARALRTLETSPKVQTRFLVRTRYRAGATEGARREQTTREFYENIAQSHYTLCVRGGGNFSKRFYEVLAMGRVPVLVDTECLLPFENRIAWDRYIVRVPSAALGSLPDRVAEHYAQARREGLAEFGKRNRELWKEWLSFGGFHRHLLEEVLKTRG